MELQQNHKIMQRTLPSWKLSDLELVRDLQQQLTHFSSVMRHDASAKVIFTSCALLQQLKSTKIQCPAEGMFLMSTPDFIHDTKCLFVHCQNSVSSLINLGAITCQRRHFWHCQQQQCIFSDLQTPSVVHNRRCLAFNPICGRLVHLPLVFMATFIKRAHDNGRQFSNGSPHY